MMNYLTILNITVKYTNAQIQNNNDRWVVNLEEITDVKLSTLKERTLALL